MEFFATCPQGFERPLANELAGLGCGQVRPLRGQVSFSGELEGAYRACLWSRLASRVVAVVARVDAHDADALYAGLRALAWEDHVPAGSTFAVDAHGTNQALRNTQFVALRSKDAIVDALVARRGTRPVVDTRTPDVTAVVRVSRERATVGIDLAGEPLFRRGYEQQPGRRATIAPVRADYAALLLHTAGWPALAQVARAEGRVPCLASLDAGAGAVLAEAAGMALGIAPGLTRMRWGLVGWGGHDAALWARLLTEARAQAEGAPWDAVRLVASDGRKGSEQACRQLLRAAGMGVGLEWQRDVALVRDADLVVADVQWSAQEGPAVEAACLTRLATLADANPQAAIASLSADDAVVAATQRERTASVPVIVGRDEAVASVFGPAADEPTRPHVTVSGMKVPTYVAGSDQFAARLAKVARQRGKWARREDVTCYRVYDADLPDYAVTIDLFEESAVTSRERPRRWLQVYEYAAPRGVDPVLAKERLMDVLAIVPRALGVEPRDTFLRQRVRARGGSQYASEEGLARGGRSRRVAGAELPPGAYLIDEGGLTFEVSFSTRLDCGIFLDHRDTRAELREMAKRMGGAGRFLNLFAYTGTATCYAADGGARHTTTVDLSKTYLDWARRNMARNGFVGAEHEFVQADVLAWVTEQRHTSNRWDLVFCDVPTFSNSQRMRKASFDVQRDHVELLIGVSRLLTRGRDGEPGGTCVFSCNLRTFKPDVEALARAGVTIEDITARTIPEDFARNQRVHHCYLVRRAAR